MERLTKVAGWLQRVTGLRVFSLGGASLAVGRIVSLVVLLTLLFVVTRCIAAWLVRRLLARGTDRCVGHAIGSIAHYDILVVGTFATHQGVGLDLSALLVIGGTLGIGIGLGLLGVTSNCLTGLIILFERPIKVGDRIEVGDLLGDVVDISPPATAVVTNDSVAVIVPKSEFVSALREHGIEIPFPQREVHVRRALPAAPEAGPSPAEENRHD